VSLFGGSIRKGRSVSILETYLINNIEVSAFKKTPEGEGWLFYPNGILSKGHFVIDRL